MRKTWGSFGSVGAEAEAAAASFPAAAATAGGAMTSMSKRSGAPGAGLANSSATNADVAPPGPGCNIRKKAGAYILRIGNVRDMTTALILGRLKPGASLPGATMPSEAHAEITLMYARGELCPPGAFPAPASHRLVQARGFQVLRV